MNLFVQTAEGGYNVTFQKGGHRDIAALWGAGNKTLVVTDSGVISSSPPGSAGRLRRARTSLRVMYGPPAA